jgi:hypothetical protein
MSITSHLFLASCPARVRGTYTDGVDAGRLGLTLAIHKGEPNSERSR